MPIPLSLSILPSIAISPLEFLLVLPIVNTSLGSFINSFLD